jgi:hypothetical protein
MDDYIAQYYRCPERYVQLKVDGTLSEESGYFSFGSDVVCYGQLCSETPSPIPNGKLYDAIRHPATENGTTYLPFDVTQVVDNLRLELYSKNSRHDESFLKSIPYEIYYLIRPLLSGGIRRRLQKARFSNWKTLKFPRWPVDRSVDLLFEQLLLVSLRSQRLERIPFIWFWPDGAPSCAIMTHDVDTQVGRDFCPAVMDLEDVYGIKSCFCIVPEKRYEVTKEYLDSLRNRGFEISVHDLTHERSLFRNRKEFLKCAEKINAYGKEFGAFGFRAGALYRNQQWFDALKFSYDMSVPNVGHLEVQRGGCCTIMPYFIGDILELPTTTTQDYALFNYLNKYSIDLWKHQIELIMEKHGLINFIIHPDYIGKPREWGMFNDLLAYLAKLREEKGVWIPMAGGVDRWWRQRAEMTLVEDKRGIRIEGKGSERARIAYASERDGKLVFEF